MPSPDSLHTRLRLNNEWHARPVATMPAPFRCTHQVVKRVGKATDSRDAFGTLCAHHGQPGPGEGSRYHLAQMGSALIKWEGHTEADSMTCLVPGNGSPLFSESASQFAPSELADVFEGDLLCGVNVEVLKQSADDLDMDAIRASLGSNEIYGGPVVDGKASLWTSFHLDAEGYCRIVLVDHSLPDTAIGRLLQRVLETESYRLMAVEGLPVARATMAELNQLESELEPLMDELMQSGETADHESLFMKLSNMSARMEHLAAESSYRFAASRAYSRIVEQRLAELREDAGLPQLRYSAYLLRTLQPAMRTCEAAERRIEELAQRVTRAITLQSSVVDLIRTRQSHAMMKTMGDHSATQIRLQQAVEGFSTFVISYYAIGLLEIMLEAGIAAQLLAVNPKIVLGIAAPIVFFSVWALTRWTRKRVTRTPK